jgi:hypothetical protein
MDPYVIYWPNEFTFLSQGIAVVMEELLKVVKSLIQVPVPVHSVQCIYKMKYCTVSI